MSRNATWTNSDGLVVGFGTHSEDNNVSGVYKGANGEVTIVAEYTMANLVDTFAAVNVNPQDARIPRGSMIKSAYIHNIIAPVSGGGGTFDLGLWGVDLATEVVDVADCLVADVTVAEFGLLGEAIQLDGVAIADAATAASTVATVGSVSNSDCVLAPSYETAVFTAGVIKVIVTYIPPAGSAGRTIVV